MIWWLLAGMTVITFFNRYVFLARTLHYQPSARVRQFLSYSSYAVLTAIWAPIVFAFDSTDGLSHAGVDYLAASVVAALLSFLRVKSLLVVVISIGIFFILRFAF